MKDRNDEDEDWAEETTEEAQRRRMEEISDHAKNLTLSDDLEKPLEERVNLFYNFVKVSSFTLVVLAQRPWSRSGPTGLSERPLLLPWTAHAGAVQS